MTFCQWTPAVSRREVLLAGSAGAAGVALPGCAASGTGTGAASPGAAPEGGVTQSVNLTVNGQAQRLELDTRTTLLDALREHLHLNGTKKGCDHGQCGACTVLIDGERVNSCLKLAVTLDGAEITTIEGLGTPDDMHPMQKAFVEHDAFQCGYCTPGQICSAVGLVNEGHARSREEIRELMSGNLCRCGAYTNIADAIEDVLAQETALPHREAAE